MKVKCIRRLYKFDGQSTLMVDENEIIEYAVDTRGFIINDVKLTRPEFFYHFEVIQGEDQMCYADFEYILCNYIFTSAVLFPNEYSGVHHLVIHDWFESILITINKKENKIRVSFETGQEIYPSYEAAIAGIKLYNKI